MLCNAIVRRVDQQESTNTATGEVRQYFRVLFVDRDTASVLSAFCHKPSITELVGERAQLRIAINSRKLDNGQYRTNLNIEACRLDPFAAADDWGDAAGSSAAAWPAGAPSSVAAR